MYNLEKNGTPVANWQLFNDFAVSTVLADHAVTYDMEWKVPCILYYMRRESQKPSAPAAVRDCLFYKKTDIAQIEHPADQFQHTFLHDASLGRSRCTDQSYSCPHGGGFSMVSTFSRLKEHELPRAGDLAAIDAEFVSLAKEDVRSDALPLA